MRHCIRGRTVWICLSKLRTAGCHRMPKLPRERNPNWKEETRLAKTHLAENRDERAAGFGQGWVAKFDCGLMSQPGWRGWVSAFEFSQDRMTFSCAFDSPSVYVRPTFKGDLHGWYSRGKRLNFASDGLNSGLFLINPNWVLSSDYESTLFYWDLKLLYAILKYQLFVCEFFEGRRNWKTWHTFLVYFRHQRKLEP